MTNMDIFTTEDGRNETVDVIINTALFGTHGRQLRSDINSYRKLKEKYQLYGQLGYTCLLSRFHLKKAGATERVKSN